MIRECPCRNCQKRNETCHSACDLYKEWKVELDKHNQEINHKARMAYIGNTKEEKYGVQK